MDAKTRAQNTVDENSDELISLSHRIHQNPELGFQEHKASTWVAEILEKAGFSVEVGVASLPTAIRATYGNGRLNIAICAEYDALANIGHACGHNIICAAGVGAALALAPLADELDITVSLMGTPAEEGEGGKVFMLERGAFDGVHAAMMVHPSRIERDVMPTLATSQWNVEYFGRSSHAAAAPDRGVSASAAIALAQVGIGMLREHFQSSDRVHGIVIEGGDAPNIIPEHTLSKWFIRAETAARLAELEEKIFNVYRGAAMMTGCRLELSPMSPALADVKSDDRLAALWRDNAAALGRDSIPVQPGDGAASTDMGNVSYVIPSIHPFIAIDSGGANIHEPSFAAAAVNASADKAVLDGAKGLAMTAIDIAQSTDLRAQLTSR